MDLNLKSDRQRQSANREKYLHLLLLAHLSRRLIGEPLSYVSMSTFSNLFSSDTTGQVEAKFQIEPPWDGGTNVYSNGPGHMTNTAAMPICG